MRALVLLVLALGVLALGALLVSAAPNLARPAYACSPVPGYNPVSDSHVVVAGRIGEWQRTGGAPTPTGVPIQMRLTVDWVFKGTAATELTIVDGSSLKPNGRWGSGGGLCEPFSRDPTGAYVVLGLNRGANGTYGTSLFKVFAFDAEPDSARYQEAVERLTQSGESTLDLADPRPCIPVRDGDCPAQRRALWDGDAAAWAAQGVTEAQARLNATIAFRVTAGDQATIAALAREAGQPYVQVSRVGYLVTMRGLVFGVPSSREEFVELVNLGGADQDLTGWTVHSPERGVTLAVPSGVVLKPRDTCRLAQSATPRGRCAVEIQIEDLWPDSGGRVVLMDAEGIVRADLRYSADPYNQPPPPHLQGVRLPPR